MGARTTGIGPPAAGANPAQRTPLAVRWHLGSRRSRAAPGPERPRLMKDTAGLVARMAEAAQALLDSLSAEQRPLAHWPFPSDEERRLWFYTPTDHGGLTLTHMRPAQQRLAMKLLATGLSRAGYVTAATIIGLENVLDELEGFRVSFGRERGRDPTLYYLRIFGEPGSSAWSWRFGGHHVSVHHTILGGE